MTGFFLRVQRDGRWQNLDIAELTDEELHTTFDERPDCAKWVVALAGWIRDPVGPEPVPIEVVE